MRAIVVAVVAVGRPWRRKYVNGDVVCRLVFLDGRKRIRLAIAQAYERKSALMTTLPAHDMCMFIFVLDSKL